MVLPNMSEEMKGEALAKDSIFPSFALFEIAATAVELCYFRQPFPAACPNRDVVYVIDQQHYLRRIVRFPKVLLCGGDRLATKPQGRVRPISSHDYTIPPDVI
ncbi:MAG: hypothetical protein WC696_07715 [Candidatus Methylopumilus sp.]